MQMSQGKRKAAGYLVTAVVAYFTGEWLPPEVVGEVVGGLVGLI